MKVIIVIILGALTGVGAALVDTNKDLSELNETVDQLSVRLADLDQELRDRRIIEIPIVFSETYWPLRVYAMPLEPVDIEALKHKVIMLADTLGYDFITENKKVVPARLTIKKRHTP